MAEKKLVLMAVLATSFVVPFMGSAINLAVPAMGDTFGVNPASLSWVVSSYILASVSILLPIGRIADIKGRKRIYTLGVFFMAIFTCLCSFSWSVESLILFRIGQGLASSMLFSTGMAMIISVHEKNERGKVIGLSAASTYIGLSLGPMLGGVITHYFGWHMIFHVTTFILLVISLPAIKYVKMEWYGEKDAYFDKKGSLYYVIASPAVLYGFSALFSNPAAIYYLIVGIIFLFLFIRYQMRCAEPIFDVNLFKGNTIFAMSNLAAMINYSATFAIGFVLSLYLQVIRGLDSYHAGLILLIQPVLMAMFSPMAGSLSDRIDPRIVASIGMGLNAIGLGIFIFLGMDTPYWILCIVFVIIGIGFALFSSPNNNAIMGAVSPQYYGVAASALSCMRLVGQAMSIAIVTAVFSIYTLDVQDSRYLEELLYGTKIAFVIFTILCTLGVGASLARGKQNQ